MSHLDNTIEKQLFSYGAVRKVSITRGMQEEIFTDSRGHRRKLRPHSYMRIAFQLHTDAEISCPLLTRTKVGRVRKPRDIEQDS